MYMILLSDYCGWFCTVSCGHEALFSIKQEPIHYGSRVLLMGCSWIDLYVRVASPGVK